MCEYFGVLWRALIGRRVVACSHHDGIEMSVGDAEEALRGFPGAVLASRDSVLISYAQGLPSLRYVTNSQEETGSAL